ncbi:MAG: hypothetical protein AW07_01383 [Candidatus Accumulibacter sp. SK-11]|nr:MAG: hypothetical protein AW07_01383 [Candidatus Accumulibacter sp. SK-11]
MARPSGRRPRRGRATNPGASALTRTRSLIADPASACLRFFFPVRLIAASSPRSLDDGSAGGQIDSVLDQHLVYPDAGMHRTVDVRVGGDFER